MRTELPTSLDEAETPSIAQDTVQQELTPRETVTALDRYVIGQTAAKSAVAVALRNRWRRMRTPSPLREEIMPKNLILIGPTGCGKTEIARRIARLVGAPFIKVETSKFTEVGYVGRDVESIIRDLVEVAVGMQRKKRLEAVRERAVEAAEERLLDALLPTLATQEGSSGAARELYRERLRRGELDSRRVEVELRERTNMPELNVPGGIEQLDSSFREIFSQLLPQRKKRRQLTVAEARAALREEEGESMLDMDEIVRQALRQVEHDGVVFLDEMDKITTQRGAHHGPDISRAGVQRDLLPIVEGSVVQTRRGSVRTDHMLFIAAGTFQQSRPSDLMPELQGRFPIRVELEALKRADLVRILTEPQNALLRQYSALLKTEGVHLEFTPEAVETLAEFAEMLNVQSENIGARRLHTILERVLEEVSFAAPELRGQQIKITPAYIHERLDTLTQNQDLSRYIL